MNISEPPLVSIRPVKAWSEYLAAEELQRVVWQMPDWRDAVPANLLITAQKNGGLVLGAFMDERLIGFAFSFLGAEEHQGQKKIKHCSHMLAVLPKYQSLKIGVRLKFKQRELALAQGIDLITWTYDPLQALNANLNLARLGAIARRYVPNAYGEMTDGLNVGLPSDRFEVEWWLNTPRVRERAAGNDASSRGTRERSFNENPPQDDASPHRADWGALVHAGAQEIFEIALDTQHLPHIKGENELRGDWLLVEIPDNLGTIKTTAPDLAREWRSRTRGLFQRAFAAGYAAVDFVVASRGGDRHAAYVLTRKADNIGV
jgi:predicted GNAT superfamily acetyltransferase